MKLHRVPYVEWMYLMVSAIVLPGGLFGGFAFEQPKVKICIIPDYNHFPVRVGVSTESGKECLGKLKVTSDADWVKPTVDLETGELVLTLDTLRLFNKKYTATIHGDLDGIRSQVVVEAVIVGMEIQKMTEDPFRPRVYAISAPWESLGSLLVYDPFHGKPAGSVTVGKAPSDLALSNDWKELLVINSGNQTVNILETETMEVKQTVDLPVWGKDGNTIRPAHIGTGPKQIFYYTDGAPNPGLHVYDRCQAKVVQTQHVGKPGTGNFAITRDRSKLVAWTQDSWHRGLQNTTLAVFKVGKDGRLDRPKGQEPADKETFRQAARETPVLLAKKAKSAIIHRYAFPLNNPSAGKVLFPEAIVALSGSGKFAASTKALYEAGSGRKLADLPGTVDHPAFFNALGKLVYFSSENAQVTFLDLNNLLKPSIPGLPIHPNDGAVCLPPTELKWEYIHWADSYDVFLGNSEEAVLHATRDSPEFLGNGLGPTFALPSPLPAGKTYYWRRDVVTGIGTKKGAVHHFLASKIALSQTALFVSCLAGHKSTPTRIDLASATPGQPWRVTTSQAWIQPKQKTGKTPDDFIVAFDASELKAGKHTGIIELHVDCASPLQIPVELEVIPLVLTQLVTRLDSPIVYGITEAQSGKSPSKAFLMEINTKTGKILRTLEVGSSVSDLALHEEEGRIYIPNWKQGELLAVDMEKFQKIRSYRFSPFKGVGYSRSDVYKVSAGRKGRLVIEAADQWVDMSLLDTESGKVLSRINVRQGDGVFPSPGRYYYHGDSNISNASLHKYDTVGDTFKKLKSARPKGGRHSGARTVVATRDGSKIFWNGSMFDSNLNVLWSIGEEIQSLSPDGKLGFGLKQIYNLQTRKAIQSMPPKAKPNTFNPITRKLVVQEGEGIRFIEIPGPAK